MAEKQTRQVTAHRRDVSSAEIREELARTRSHMDETLDALSERLHPRQLLDRLLDAFRGGGKSTGKATGKALENAGVRIYEEVKHHPVPAVLVGAGLAWLLYEKGSSSGRRTLPDKHIHSIVDARTGEPYVDPWDEIAEAEDEKGEESLGSRAKGRLKGAAGFVRERARGVKARAEEWGCRARERASSAAGAMRARASGSREALGGMAQGARRRAGKVGHDVREGVSHAVRDYPLAVAGAALVSGLVAGLAFRSTRREDELMGEASDELKERTRKAGEDLLDRGRHLSSKTVEALKEEAERQGLDPRSLTERLESAAARIQEAAGEAVKEEGLDAGSLREKAGNVADEARETAREESRRHRDDLENELSGEENRGTGDVPHRVGAGEPGRREDREST